LQNSIFVEDGFSRPVIREISAVSTPIRGLQRTFEVRRVCFPAELDKEIGEIYL
jgi:hypothetical protein